LSSASASRERERQYNAQIAEMKALLERRS
jgi:hypothetical protein